MQAADCQGIALIRKNPRFSLDNPSLYANLLRVTTWHTGPGGDGTKPGFPGFRSFGFPAALRHSITAFPLPSVSAILAITVKYNFT